MPKAAPRPCTFPGCRAYAAKDGRCDQHKHQAGWQRSKTESASQRGYGHRWRKIRDRIMARDRSLCQTCLRLGIFTRATEVDHIACKALGGSDSDDNLEAICRTCHKRKTQQEAKYGQGEGKK